VVTEEDSAVDEEVDEVDSLTVEVGEVVVEEVVTEAEGVDEVLPVAVEVHLEVEDEAVHEALVVRVPEPSLLNLTSTPVFSLPR
jgi:hypothetical protein